MFAKNPAGKYPDKSTVPPLPKILLLKTLRQFRKYGLPKAQAADK
jgi:hypothetical protein